MPGTFYEKSGTAGQPTEDMEVIIADELDREVPRGTIGEILVRPRHPGTVFSGYYRKDAATVAGWRNLWFHTGDRAYMDEDDFLFFVDRAKDTIRRRGENISGQEVENAINAHEGVVESAAVPVPSDIGEDDVCLYVSAKDGISLDPTELFEFAKERLPYFMVPRYIGIIDDFPRTPSYKIQKFALRETAAKNLDALWDAEAHGLSPRRE
jgi:crotonobetaine/carnitine-CoA ligase